MSQPIIAYQNDDGTLTPTDFTPAFADFTYTLNGGITAKPFNTGTSVGLEFSSPGAEPSRVYVRPTPTGMEVLVDDEVIGYATLTLEEA